MMKGKKITAFMIAAIMVMSNFMGLLGNISFANGDEITVEFSVENDGAAHLSEDGKTLNYECSDGSSYDIQLRQNGQAIQLTVQNDPEHGDKYIATGITSNEDLQIYSPRINLGVLGVFFGGQQMGMFPSTGDDEDYYSSVLAGWANDTDYYQIRIQEVLPGENGGGEGNNTADRDFNVDFGTATWTIDDETVTASIEGIESLTDGLVKIKGNTEIVLSNWNPDLMEVSITIIDDQGREFGTRLFVDENGVTRMMDFDAGNLPDGNVVFTVQRKSEHHDDGGQQENMAETIYSVDFGEATWEVRNKETQAIVIIDGESLDLTNGLVEIRGDQEITLSNWDAKLMQARIIVVDPKIEPERYFSTRLHVEENGITRIMDIESDNIPWGDEGMYLEFVVERYQGDLPEWNLPEPNDSAEVTVRSVTSDPASPDMTEPVDYTNARVAINGFPVIFDDPNNELNIINQTENSTTIGDFGYYYDANENDGKVRITFSAIFDTKYVGSVFVNGQEFIVNEIIDYSNGTDWLMHYNQQEVGFDVLVDKADSYDIGVELAEMNGDYIAVGNFLWTDNPDNFDKDDYVGNATLELLQVDYEIDINGDGDYNDIVDGNSEQVTVYFDEYGDFDDPYGIIEYAPYGEVGSLVVPAYSKCLMRITPDYGYQVLAFGGNGEDFLTGNISEFTFFAHKGNFHLAAHVVPVDDAVYPITEKITNGTIEIGNDEIETGTVALTVDDLVDLTDEKVAEFENAAGDYTVDTYLDISLDQVFYKGSIPEEINENTAWTNEMHNLKEDAAIELELKDGLDNKDVIIIHNIDNGDQYEVIDTEYDEETNTISFATRSFSNYAIAVKDKEGSEDPEIPQEEYTLTSGDYIAEFVEDEGYDFELEVIDLLNLPEEVLDILELTEEEYEQEKEYIAELVSEYGEVIAGYGISIFDYDENFGHFGETIFKIKMTDEIAEYNNYLLIGIDNETIEDEEIVEVSVEEGYLVGNIPYTGNYILVGEKEEEPEIQQVDYTLTSEDENYIVEFTQDEGYDFELEVIEAYHFTPEMLEAIGFTEEEYEEAKEEIADFVEDYGEIINLYMMSIYDEENEFGQYGRTTFKIKMTEDMEDYENLKLIYIDVDELEDEDIVEVEIEDGYIVGNLPYVGNYVLVGEKAEEELGDEVYTITTDEITVIFVDEEGHEFELEIEKLLNLTPEELEEMDITEEEYEQVKAQVIEALKEYGTILEVYGIYIYDGQYDHENGVTIKIKMSDEMKEYNSFKFICIDNETITDNDIVDLKVEGEYLTGNLKHLSNYALVAKKVDEPTTDEPTTETTTTTETAAEEKTTNNPTTGDNIMFFALMFIISIAGIACTIKSKK